MLFNALQSSARRSIRRSTINRTTHRRHVSMMEQAWTKEPTLSLQMQGFAKENPKTAIAAALWTIFEFTPYGPTGFFLRLPFKMAQARKDEAAKWDTIEVVAVAEPGETMSITNPHALAVEFNVKVPEGKKMGDSFKVKVPRASAQTST